MRYRSSLKLAVLASVVFCGAALAVTLGDPLAPVGLGKQPANAPAKPVTETLFGTKVTDPYRYMEKLDKSTLDWMKAQGAYTRSVFDAVGPRKALLKRMADLGASFGFVQGYQTYGGRQFFEERAPGSDNFDLVVKDGKGERKLVDVAAYRAAHSGKPYAISFYQPSFDGGKVAVGISEGGSEDASTFVYDAVSGAQIAGPVDRTQFGIIAWAEDGKTIYLNRLIKMKPSDPPTEKYLNSTIQTWDMKSEPHDLLGGTSGHGPHFTPVENPALAISPKSPNAILLNVNGVQNEWKIYTAPIADAGNPDAKWQLLADRSDNVTNMDVRGDEMFLLSHQDAPTFKVLSLKAGQKLADATTLVPAQPGRIIQSIHAASDALYVVAREGIYSHILRIPAGSTKIEEIALPIKGDVSEAFTDPRVSGITVNLESWALPPTIYAYDPKTKKFVDQELGIRPAFDSSAFAVKDIEATAKDGTKVPLTYISLASAKGPQIALVDAYGSYGISQLPGFSPRLASFIQEGAAYAECHVRGGGELGEAWRLAGKDDKKSNTWNDLIACGEDLIARGLTTKDKLFIIGGSAGGITMGRAMTERPDLFAGVIDEVPASNTLRFEFSANGPNNIPEFGTITNEQGFKNLLAMDSIQHVKDGTVYPPVMITTGLNDPRVSPWEPAKFAARLLASGTPNPVLLRVETDAGHGIGSTKTQRDEEFADVASFVFWRAGKVGWRPGETGKSQ